MTFDLKVFREALQADDAPLAVYDSQTNIYRMIPASLDPLVIEDEIWEPIVETSQLVLKSMNAIIRLGGHESRGPTSDRLFRELSPFEKSALVASSPSPLATARFDLFFDRDGLKIIEANTTIPAMQAYSDIVQRAWLRASGYEDQRSPNSDDLLESLLFLYRQQGGSTAHPRIAIVARAGDSQISELRFLKARWQDKGFSVKILQPDDLKMNGDHLKEAKSGDRYDLIYRHIFASRLVEGSDFSRALLQNEIFHIYNPLAAHLEIKALFAELSHFAGSPELSSAIGLTARERDLLQLYLPWTRVLQKSATLLELEEWKALPAEDYVIKSSSGYGGHMVFIGSEFQLPESQSRLQKLMKRKGVISWSNFIDFCASESGGLWIIQRRLQGHRMKHRFFYDKVSEQESYVDASIFAWAHSVPRGGASRFALDPIVNLGRGGGLLPMFLRSEFNALFKQ